MSLTFGEKIKEARKSKKLTQKQLASKIGAAHNSISDWENDKNKPDPDTIELLCGILEITPNYLLASTSEDFSPAEKLIIKKYRNLDNYGRETIDIALERESTRVTALNKKESRIKELEIAVSTPAMPDYLIPNAAHERTDIEVTDEMKKHDNDIMDDDSEWE